MASLCRIECEQTFVVARQVENGGQIEFEKLLGDGQGTLIVETPLLTVGQDAPTQLARREVVDPPQVAQHLAGRCGFFTAAARAAVERAKPALRLKDGDPEARTASIPRQRCWRDSWRRRRQTANRRGRLHGRVPRGSADAGSPSSPTRPALARSNHPRSDFRSETLSSGSGRTRSSAHLRDRTSAASVRMFQSGNAETKSRRKSSANRLPWNGAPPITWRVPLPRAASLLRPYGRCRRRRLAAPDDGSCENGDIRTAPRPDALT